MKMMIMSIDVRDDVIHLADDDREENYKIFFFVKIEKAKKNSHHIKKIHFYIKVYIGKDRKLHYRIYTTDE